MRRHTRLGNDFRTRPRHVAPSGAVPAVQVAELCTLPELNHSEFDHRLDVELGPLGPQPTERFGPALLPGGIELYEKALSEFLEGLFGSAATPFRRSVMQRGA